MIAGYGWTPAWFDEHYPYAIRDHADALAARRLTAQTSGAMSAAARAAPSVSTGR